MAGLAAALNAPDSIDALAWALAPRGADGALCRLAGAGGADLVLAIRAAMPAIPRVVPPLTDADGAEPVPIAAFVIDGIASVTALDQGYAADGPSGLIDGGPETYAVILADAERDELVLARNGDGPGLYYARLGDGWVVASEPGALVQAGVGADPDVGVIRHFITTAACDDTERTFFARIRRVLPGEAVVLPAAGRVGAVRHATAWRREPDDVEHALRAATVGARVGVLLTPGLPGAAVLGTALSNPMRPLPVPVHTGHWSGIDWAAQSPAVLSPVAHGVVRTTDHEVALTKAELERFLAEVGEPVPDLGYILTWTVVRHLESDVDTLVDASLGPVTGVERMADRLLSRYGVTVQFPLRVAEASVEHLAAVAGRTLPANVASQAATDPARTPTAADVIRALGDEVAAAFVTPRPWATPAASVTALRRLHAGEPADADALLRAYLVERWLAGLWATAIPADTMDDEPAPASAESTVDVAAPAPDSVTIGGDSWLRIPVRTAVVRPGDEIAVTVGWHVATVLAELRRLAESPTGPWYVVVSGKAVAVSQNRVAPVLDIQPGRSAHLLSRWSRRHQPELAEPWTMQVALDHSGLGRVAGAVLFGQSLAADAGLYPPRPGAIAPADAAVVQAPFEPDDVATALLAAVRYAAPRDLVPTLAGCAVVSADDQGCRVLGYANGPYADASPRPRTLLGLILADNPAGQGGERTPAYVLMSADGAPPRTPHDAAGDRATRDSERDTAARESAARESAARDFAALDASRPTPARR
jgi:hypothetical protein